LISFKGEFVIFAAKLKDDSYLLKERLLSHNGEFVSIKGWKNNGGNVVFNGRIVIEPADTIKQIPSSSYHQAVTIQDLPSAIKHLTSSSQVELINVFHKTNIKH